MPINMPSNTTSNLNNKSLWNKTLSRCIWTLGLLGSSWLSAQSLDPAKLYQQQCVACHGANAEGNQALKAPKLAGQMDWYLVNQLNTFKNKQRGGTEGDSFGSGMAAMAANLTEQQISGLATYLSGLQSKAASDSAVNGDLVKGEQFYQSLCGSCHGPGGKGNKALNSPKLAGLNDWYLVEQIQKFRSGKRGYHADDRLGRQMKMMSGILPGEDAIKAVSSYLSTQNH